MTILQAVSNIFDIGYSCIFFLALSKMLTIRKNKIIQIISLLIFIFLCTTPIYAQTVFNLLLAVASFILYVIAFYRTKWDKKVLSVLIFSPVILAVNYLLYDIRDRVFLGITGVSDTAVYWSQNVILTSDVICILAAVVRCILAVCVYYFTSKYLSHITEKMTAKMSMILSLLLLAPNIAVFTMIYFMPNNPLLLYPICIAAVFSGFGVIYFAAYICDNMEMKYHVRELELQQSFYEERKIEGERVQRIYHDMKNHLLVLQARLNEIGYTGNQEKKQETGEMITKLQNQISEYEDYVQTGNAFLDVILRDKTRKAKEESIDFHIEIDFSMGNFIDALDISTIFGNALDNAIEACEKVLEEERFITMKAGERNHFLVIHIENSAIQEEEEKKTTKEDTFLHGFGLKNIQRAAEKYGGQCKRNYQNGVYMLSILIPIAEK